ncbi:hypothetical protein AV926_09425 [Myroides marinus]|uniref:J domain-containing protein n=1 Tax=Myroides marinus TaxID=703342 RepID=A0A163Z4J5_9FLAO|nr:J domain-containing protein [Myroides marinus]KZE80983.1 hypothetical protein AV926_09425 [Myroides marinus]
MNQNSNYYKVLGIDPTVSDEELHRVFKGLFARYNPSSNPNSMYLKTMYQQLNEAFEVLGDRTRREQYNLERGFGAPIRSEVVTPVNNAPPALPNREHSVSESRVTTVKESNTAYIFLFVLIGILVIGGGGFAYFTLNGDKGKSNEIVTEEAVKTPLVNNDAEYEKSKGEIIVAKEQQQQVLVDKEEEKQATEITVSKSNTEQIVKNEEKVVKKTTESVKSETVAKLNDRKEQTPAKRAFRLGASKNDVWAAKGDPTDITTSGDLEIWHYGKTRIKFRDGKVVD